VEPISALELSQDIEETGPLLRKEAPPICWRLEKAQRNVRKTFSGKKKMTSYVSFLLGVDAARQRLTHLFQSEGFGLANQLSTTLVAGDSSRAGRVAAEQKTDTFRECRRTHKLIRNRTSTAIRGQIKRDPRPRWLSFQCSIDHGHHVVELHASRRAETGTFVAFIYQKGSEWLLHHIVGTDENEVIGRAVEWCERN
jgi:hypothetical protein